MRLNKKQRKAKSKKKKNPKEEKKKKKKRKSKRQQLCMLLQLYILTSAVGCRVRISLIYEPYIDEVRRHTNGHEVYAVYNYYLGRDNNK